MNAQASVILRTEAKFRWPTLDYHQDRIWRLKDWLAWTPRRVRSIYNQEDGVVLSGSETLRLQEIEEQQKARRQQREVEEANRDDFQALQARIARLEAALFSQDEEFHHVQMAGLRQATDRGRGDHVAGATGLAETD